MRTQGSGLKCELLAQNPRIFVRLTHLSLLWLVFHLNYSILIILSKDTNNLLFPPEKWYVSRFTYLILLTTSTLKIFLPKILGTSSGIIISYSLVTPASLSPNDPQISAYLWGLSIQLHILPEKTIQHHCLKCYPKI